MPTNDGFSPYPLGLSAVETKVAITRAHNLSTEFGGYLGFSDTVSIPTIAGGIKGGDIWHNPTLDVFFRAHIDSTGTPTLVFFEV